MNVPHLTDLAALDRDVSRAHAAWLKWKRALAAEPEAHEDEAPLDQFRHVAGQSTFDALGKGDPAGGDALLREGLRRWVYALMLARIAQPLDVELAKAASEESAPVTVPRPHLASWRQAWRGLLVGGTPTERAAWLAVATERGPAIASVERRRSERRTEAEDRMRFEGGDPLFDAPPANLFAAAEALLDRTEDLAREQLTKARRRAELADDPPAATDAIALALARDAPEGWPPRLAWPWFDETFGAFARGLRLSATPLPDALGAASFARGCAAFGRALRIAGASPSLPFTLAREPEFTAMHRFAGVFGALPASAAFQRRALRNVARVADAQARVLTRSVLFESRLEAVRFILERDRTPDRFEDLTHRLFGAPLPRPLAGAWPATRDDGRARLVGLLTARALAEELVERFDIDWFANPRGILHVRTIASGPAREPLDPDQTNLVTAAFRLARTFEETLG
jgi:hypothetical protein